MKTGDSDITPSVSESHHPMLKVALELGPLLVFFFANMRADWLLKEVPALAVLGDPLFVASGFFMVATVISLIASRILFGSIPVVPLISGIIVIIFGALGFWLQDKVFFFMKPTIINTLLGVVLLVGLAFGRSLLGYVFNAAFQLDEEGWRKLTQRWGFFFLFLAILNEIVWRTVVAHGWPDSYWVTFKVWGTMPITLLFTFAQMPLIMKHTVAPPEAAGTEK